ncbi:site-specific DNA-methyltransferase [Myxococcota bacterium]|nr:site-specific DNA-methyltransferase [Myxococcota bacterium]MBU1382100.1 site-specific DNA-methyltransferase [Myxococcota bacterium]MBU1498103.1 site-specific DNA-methyltransferase [Myxococcota bacterium]
MNHNNFCLPSPPLFKKHLSAVASSSGRLFHCSALECLAVLAEDSFIPDLVYIDPPFGKNRYFGSEETGYEDPKPSEILKSIEEVIYHVKNLLDRTGSIIIHVDNTLSHHIRIIGDTIFGGNNFRNQIIWSYRTGGRPHNSYPRKYDTLLWYSKSPNYHFNSTNAVVDTNRCSSCGQKLVRNHLKKTLMPDGSIVKSIKSGGKTYTYNDDRNPTLTDVWNDIPHLHQLDPQRTHWPTQKPVALLERILKIHVPSGGRVIDLFCGSGTTFIAAENLGITWAGCDIEKAAIDITWQRLTEVCSGAEERIERFEK